MLGKSQSTLANWRTLGIGPAWFKVGGRVYYRFDDLVAYGTGEASAPQAA
ncbi:helix-turn-helix domain-containing protein [Sphingomonas piscis]|uniref:Helix-turn-helix domain-containing protein n=1 Tax=Sphingomonas piscis TaxID=2714943 RepID=A0A6G7YT11_9SPHN|nr:helix-turn-helix domain-containing protein [Sphingomonas piscis]